MNKKNINIGIILAFTLLLSFNALSVGVSSLYYDTNPLVMSPGETKDITLGLQNMVGSEDVTMKGSITQGNDVALITDANPVYPIPLGSKDTLVNIRVTIPEDTPYGDYYFTVSFVTVTPGDTTGTVRMGIGIDKIIPIRVEAPLKSPESQRAINTSFLMILIIVIALVAILVLAIIKKQKKPSNRRI